MTLPLRTVSEANRRGHWSKHHKRHQEHRFLAAHMLQQKMPLPSLPATVRMIRHGPRKLDTDNLASSMKHIRDGIADAYEVDDADERYSWQYDQEMCKEYKVVVEITA